MKILEAFFENMIERYQIIPAAPGWEIALPSWDSNGLPNDFVLLPILAWAVMAEWTGGGEFCVATINPITIETDCETPVIRSPNGEYSTPEGHRFKNKDSVLAYFKEKDAAAAEKIKRQQFQTQGGTSTVQ